MFCVGCRLISTLLALYYVYFLSKNGPILYYIYVGCRQSVAEIFYSIYTKTQVVWVDIIVFN